MTYWAECEDIFFNSLQIINMKIIQIQYTSVNSNTQRFLLEIIFSITKSLFSYQIVECNRLLLSSCENFSDPNFLFIIFFSSINQNAQHSKLFIFRVHFFFTKNDNFVNIGIYSWNVHTCFL